MSSLLLQIDPPAIICSYRTEQKSEIIKEIEVSVVALKPIELIMDYMQKRIDQIDETRRSFKAQYPDLLPQ
jgi:hypothetical protein